MYLPRAATINAVEAPQSAHTHEHTHEGESGCSRGEEVQAAFHDHTITSTILEGLPNSTHQVSLPLLEKWLQELLWTDIYDDADGKVKSMDTVLANSSTLNGGDAVSDDTAAATSKGQEIFRMKACLSVQGSEEKQFVQVVQQMYDLFTGEPWSAEEERASRVVVIGRHLDVPRLEEGFAKCFVKVAQ